jgi:glycolate oxidase iron-sulfur subunit
MKDYSHFLENDLQYAEKAREFSAKVLDISEFLTQIGYDNPENPLNTRVTYHEPCHLVHGQKVKNPPREIINSIPGVQFTELPESDWCCGSAGIYNITQYDASMELLERKMNNIKRVNVDYVVSGNPGCLLQLIYGTKKFDTDVKIIHPVTLLNMSYNNGKKKFENDKKIDNI